MDKHDSDLEEPGELPDSDNDHMYDDIEDFDLGKEVEKLKTENSMLKDHITSLERDIEKLTKAIVTLKKVQENLEKNISSLYLTAKAEIDRKNRQIAELQRELDDFKFRRKRPAPGHPQFHQVKRARYEISEEQYGNWQHPHQSIGFNHGESDGSMTQFSTRKLKVDENRGSRKEKYELLDNNEKRKRDNDQIGDRQDTPDSVEKTSNDPNRDREVENTQNSEKDSNEQSSRQKQEEYERTRGYREDAYERHSSTQKRQRFNDETDDRHDTPDIEDRRSDIDSLRGRELENRLGDDRHYSRNRQEEFERTRGYRDRRYGEFDTERRDRNWHDHPKNRLGWAYHKEPDMYDDRGYRGGRDGIRDRHPRDRNFGRDRAKSRERTSNNERDRERSRDHRSERNRSRERRHKSRDAPKDETVSQEIKSTEEGELPENPNPEVARKEDPQSYVQKLQREGRIAGCYVNI
ncbi:unnamed protein product [Acanthoscelides obtectus]|uniref:Uncharacterized protein n=1 Tax=Acanthoscelides obtectus TaxID=200917 RepID=A0A9P0P8Y0_ACAOB|nr:unnamed protein product [Acanthoscelides obtectus]CAK1647159.1 hypothetical protein AOBTE_LOCUS15081 [Acanthoscelides obtectus]